MANSAFATRRFRGVSVDTRTIQPGNAFFCLRGANSDGHRFVRAAIAGGAGAIVAAKDRMPRWRFLDVPVIGVDDPLRALGDLAAEYNRGFATRTIAVTGSVGKTTTKELIAASVGAKFPIFKSPGNYNNLIGIPLVLLGRSRRTRSEGGWGILEFGMSTPGEIGRLTDIVGPSIGVVTRVGVAHLQQMKSQAAIAKAKRELFDHASPSLVAVLNVDDPYQRGWMAHWRRQTITYASGRDADITAGSIETSTEGVHCRVNGRHPFRLRLAGDYNVPNLLAAVAVGRHLGVSWAAMADRIVRVRPVAHRSRIVHWRGATLIEDCYNANPTSMVAALASLRRWPGPGPRIAVLGAMRELGHADARWYQQVGSHAEGLDMVITVGEETAKYHRSQASNRAQWIHCRDVSGAIGILKKHLKRGDVVLLKASHAEHFEEIVPRLRESIRTRP
ncbi:MAG: UDP-N-acetylmuramoyl-tripeptide--D-alanyl-D-alanine ligase [candidate division Zixibacteria bacterium]|nr:UDP-N-acetylmuramoyl-tripeptide--D-alanyl-D-alanine ligase [candidate division Zixibacteria bacterium]